MRHPRLSSFGDISIEEFLNDYWQKKPLLIRQAFPDFKCPISAEELAGFSLEEGVVSRLVIENGLDQKTSWQVLHGPLDESVFSQLPSSHWTLLVQHADLLHPDITALLSPFRFIPNWRLDDIMISYAADQGSVGPHFDYYDVFLLQAEGNRRWRLGQQCNSESPLIPDISMKILQDFDAQEDWLVEPGDLLYIPPGMAHWGEAQGECMTYSIGFRAPSHSDILLDYSAELASRSNEDLRYNDPGLKPQTHAGEISNDAIHQLQQTLLRHADNTKALGLWFGEYMTRPNPGTEEFTLDAINPEDIQSGRNCQLLPHIRAAFKRDGKFANLFICGESFQSSLELAILISDYSTIDASALSEADQSLLLRLAELELLTSSPLADTQENIDE